MFGLNCASTQVNQFVKVGRFFFIFEFGNVENQRLWTAPIVNHVQDKVEEVQGKGRFVNVVAIRQRQLRNLLNGNGPLLIDQGIVLAVLGR